MNVILRKETALQFWRHAALVEAKHLHLRETLLNQGVFLNEQLPASSVSQLLSRKREAPPRSIAANIDLKRSDMLESVYGLSRPFCISAPSRTSARARKSVKHCLIPIPPRQLIKIEEELYVVTPEQCLLELAQETEFFELLKIAYELLGIFSADEKGNLLERGQIAQLSTLCSLVKSTPQVRGRKRLENALPYVMEKSRSPRETALALILILPHRLGGYGLRKPKLNQSVRLNTVAANLYGSSACECDLCWEDASIAVFYDSKSDHLNAHQQGNDSRRTVALEQSGYLVVTVTDSQIKRIGNMNVIARIIARRLGTRIRPAGKSFAKKQHELFDAVL